MSPVFAWPSYADLWECNVATLQFDGRDGDSTVDGDNLRIAAHDRIWEHLERGLDASPPESVPEGLSDVRAHALLSCRTTQLRRPYPLAIADGGLKVEGVVSI